jgi:protein involved in ribonucleotide reduction
MLIVYFSGLSENTHRFVSKLGLPNKRIPISGECFVEEPYILIVPSYGGGAVKGSVPSQVVKFLNNENNRVNLRAVIGSGNTNFGDMYCYGAKVVANKCGVPLLYKFELMGNTKDVDCVKDGVIKFGTIN